VSQFRQSGCYGREIVGITGFEFQEEFLHRAFPDIRFVKLYGELHRWQHQYWRDGKAAIILK
jgi:hypothetical protein